MNKKIKKRNIAAAATAVAAIAVGGASVGIDNVLS